MVDIDRRIANVEYEGNQSGAEGAWLTELLAFVFDALQKSHFNMHSYCIYVVNTVTDEY